MKKKDSKRPSEFRKTARLRLDLKRLKNTLFEKGVVDDELIKFIRDIPSKEGRMTCWRKVLKRTDLSPVDYYDVSTAIEDEKLKKEAQQKYVEKTSIDDLIESIKYDTDDLKELAWQELCKRIQRRKIKRRQARKELIKIFADVKEYRTKVLNVFQYLEPEDRELQHLLDLPFAYAAEFSELRLRIESLVRKKKKRPTNTKLLNRIKKIEEQLKK